MKDMVRSCLEAHACRYREMQVTDAVKLLYQSEFGGGHMIASAEKSLRWIVDEWKKGGCSPSQKLTEEKRERLMEEESEKAVSVESIGNGMCRIYLSALDHGLYPETLNQMFVQTACRTVGSVDGFERKLEILKKCCSQGIMPFMAEELEDYLEKYKQSGYPAVSHSDRYRSLYHPAYRVAAEYYARFYQVFLEIDRIRRRNQGKTTVVAIEGMCGSGKTTLGQILKEIYGCNLFHMDDFFLRTEQRSKERLSQIGGNIDYERFKAEILDRIGDEGGVEYRPYDCGRGVLMEPVKVPHCDLNIVEGAYSLHPYFEDAYDICFFYEVDEDEQLRRICKRNGSMWLKRFREEWIPMEQKYFETFQIWQRCLVLKQDGSIVRRKKS